MLFAPEITKRRRPSLTPMIDVVFLLLVFFMLAARFGVDQVLPLPLAGDAGGDYRGAPRLVDVRPSGVALNGVPMADGALAGALAPLVAAPTDTVVLRGRDGADVQRIVDIAEALSAAGFPTLVLAE
ncbi:MAG: biopolymer transporter ExbD [Pseudomonadota bacterium]